MPVYIHLANLIIDKQAVANKYEGGIAQFRLDYINNEQEYNQEDNELFSIIRMNADEFDIDVLVAKGLHYDEKLNYSTDFTIYARYSGYSWKADWLWDNTIFAWHIDANKELVKKAGEIAEMPLDKIGEMADKGINLMQTIRR